MVDVWQMNTELQSTLGGDVAASPASIHSGTVASQLAQQAGTLHSLLTAHVTHFPHLMPHSTTTTPALDTFTMIHYIVAYVAKPDLEPNSHDTDSSSDMSDLPELVPDSDFDDMPDLGLGMTLALGPLAPLYCDG